MMQNDLEITLKSEFWIGTKTLPSDMSGRSAGSWGTVEVWILKIFTVSRDGIRHRAAGRSGVFANAYTVNRILVP